MVTYEVLISTRNLILTWMVVTMIERAELVLKIHTMPAGLEEES